MGYKLVISEILNMMSPNEVYKPAFKNKDVANMLDIMTGFICAEQGTIWTQRKNSINRVPLITENTFYHLQDFNGMGNDEKSLIPRNQLIPRMKSWFLMEDIIIQLLQKALHKRLGIFPHIKNIIEGSFCSVVTYFPSLFLFRKFFQSANKNNNKNYMELQYQQNHFCISTNEKQQL